MREGFTLSCVTVVYNISFFLQKLRSRFDLNFSNVYWHNTNKPAVLMSFLMGTLAPSVCKHHCPFGGCSGDVLIWETLLWQCMGVECTFSAIWFSGKHPLPLCKAVCDLALHRPGVWTKQRIVSTCRQAVLRGSVVHEEQESPSKLRPQLWHPTVAQVRSTSFSLSSNSSSLF